MASPGYMWIKDENGADVKGNVDIQDRQGSVEVHSCHGGVEIPVDANTGSITGVRRQKDLVMKVRFSPATPILFKACTSGKTLNQIAVDWYETDTKKGGEKKMLTDTLTGVKVVSFNTVVDNVKDAKNDGFDYYNEIALRYNTRELAYHEGNIVAKDSWEVQS